MSKSNFYSILGVSKLASQEEIKASYLKLAMKYHPDRNQTNKEESEKKFKEVVEAYETISDKEKRKIYDQFGHDGYKQRSNNGGNQNNNNNNGFDDIFSQFADMFGEGIFGNRGRQKSSKKEFSPKNGHSIESEIKISLKESFTGSKETIKINRFISCSKCNGRGSEKENSIEKCQTCKGAGEINYQQGWLVVRQECNQCNGDGYIIKDPCSDCTGSKRIRKAESVTITIPAGINNGDVLRVSGYGDFGIDGGATGDLLLSVIVMEDKTFKRIDDNLESSIKVPYPYLVFGCDTVVLTIDEKREEIKIPEGCQVGEKIIIKGKGFTRLKAKGKGDFIITITCEIPKKLSSASKEILKKYTEDLLNNKIEKTNDGFLSGLFKNIFK